MSYIQLVQPNLSTKGTVGFCLDYARRVYGAQAIEPSAWAAWGATQYKHEDGNIPSDVSVPMWYSYWATIGGIYANWGHVTVSVPGRGIYSSPYRVGQDFAVLTSIAQVEQIYGVKYVGWSEDISRVKVIEETIMPVIDKNMLENLSVGHLGRTSVGDKNLANWIGVEVSTIEQINSVLAAFIHYPEHQALIQRADGTLPNGYKDPTPPTPGSPTILGPGLYEFK